MGSISHRIARGIDAVNLGFASNTRAYILYIPERKALITTNQIKFDESEFPFRKAKMVEQYLSDNSTDILFQSAADVTWVLYNKFHVGDYEKAHHDKIGDVVVRQINLKENTFTRAIMHKWTMDRLELEHTRNREIQAHFAEVKHKNQSG